jgi:hypothetical protein
LVLIKLESPPSQSVPPVVTAAAGGAAVVTTLGVPVVNAVGSAMIFPFYLKEANPPRRIVVDERIAISSGDIIIFEIGYNSPIGRFANGVFVIV